MNGDLLDSILNLKHQSELSLKAVLKNPFHYELFCEQDKKMMGLIKGLL